MKLQIIIFKLFNWFSVYLRNCLLNIKVSMILNCGKEKYANFILILLWVCSFSVSCCNSYSAGWNIKPLGFRRGRLVVSVSTNIQPSPPSKRDQGGSPWDQRSVTDKMNRQLSFVSLWHALLTSLNHMSDGAPVTHCQALRSLQTKPHAGNLSIQLWQKHCSVGFESNWQFSKSPFLSRCNNFTSLSHNLISVIL